jgi:hypothetical protein
MVRIELPPADELSPPVPDDSPELGSVARRRNGTVVSSEAARVLGAKGGRVKARRVALARTLGLPPETEDAKAFAPYRKSASKFRSYHCAELARAAGGECTSGPASFVASAALQLAASRFLFDQGSVTGDPATLKAASQLANDSRQNLLAAYELAQRMAAARPKTTGLAALRARAAQTSQSTTQTKAPSQGQPGASTPVAEKDP